MKTTEELLQELAKKRPPTVRELMITGRDWNQLREIVSRGYSLCSHWENYCARDFPQHTDVFDRCAKQLRGRLQSIELAIGEFVKNRRVAEELAAEGFPAEQILDLIADAEQRLNDERIDDEIEPNRESIAQRLAEACGVPCK